MDKQQKLILLAAVAGLSAVGLLVLLRRRYRDEEFDSSGVKGSNECHEEFAEGTTSETVASASESLMKINVPHYCVGPIIGKGGENIRHLRKETGTRWVQTLGLKCFKFISVSASVAISKKLSLIKGLLV